MDIQLPNRGFVFWPVGTGDSTTIRIDESIYLQLDLRHMVKSEDSEDSAWPIIDELVKILPKLGEGKPFLSTFALTHPDLDHCQGFKDFNERIFISEIWMSPRTFREFRENDDLCEDAKEFHKEAMRRVKATIEAKGDPGGGHRIRIIGYDDLLKEDAFLGFPENLLSIPGHTITQLDGEDHTEIFGAFVHAPFKDDSFGDRNDCSLAFQVTLKDGTGVGQALLMGDLKYPIIKTIFERSTDETLQWNVLLAPHHCSKSVMYWKDEGENEANLKSDMVRDLGNKAQNPGYIISSSEVIPSSNDPGDNPPHALAKKQYERIVPNEFFCTHEHPNESSPEPISFEVDEEGFRYLGKEKRRNPVSTALKAAGGTAATPTTATGFGRCQ